MMRSTMSQGAGPLAGPPMLVMRGVTKSFGPVTALRSGTITLEQGSIHALIGENGAGKSTMVKIIAGLYQRDGGVLELRGEPVDFSGTAAAKAAGIAVIYQEPTLFPDLTVAENIFMGRQPRGRLLRIDRRAMGREARALFERLGVRIDPGRRARGISIADQQVIEIAKAISADARVLVMDEPTAALSGTEVERLFAVARALRDEGRAILFISHRFDEIFSLCDTVTVMRDGAYVSTSPVAGTTVDELVRAMVGREVSDLFPKEEAEIGETLLRVTGLTRAGVFDDVSFEVRTGEIVGLGGLVGAGRSEVARALFGVDRYDSGAVQLGGSPIPPASPEAAMRAGIGFVPEDRRHQGLVMGMGVSGNVTLALRRRLARFGILTRAAEHAVAQQWAARLDVRTAALDTDVATLSGGNQQKVVLAKWLARSPRLLVVDEPTRGIDVGTKAEVHRIITRLAAQGVGILMISSELPELLGMSDRVVVMHEGHVTAVLDRAQATPESVMRAATGQVAA